MNRRPKATMARLPLPLGEGMRVKEETARSEVQFTVAIRGRAVSPGFRTNRIIEFGVTGNATSEGDLPVRHSADPPDLIGASLIVENRNPCCLDPS